MTPEEKLEKSLNLGAALMTDEPFTLSSEPQPAKRQRFIPEPVELLIEHPLADRNWVLAQELEPRWFLVCTTAGQTLALHENQFRIVQ